MLQEENLQNQIAQRMIQKEENKKLQSKFHSLFLLIALSLHSLFEGLAIGLQQTSETVIQVFVAVLIHKVSY